MGTFKNEAGKPVLMRMVKGIQDNKAYLGEVDGLIGDGDHGLRMRIYPLPRGWMSLA